ncbi:MAG: cytochrome c biogenesis protein ResB [Candidatus Cloacimonetes bacterium]|nr:cytochrome c biogenesis protein ResB [Candidatus Cloacimonadota bacterium]
MAFLKRLYRIISSLGFGITILVLMALTMAFATKFESATSTHLAQVYIYRSWWFDLMLILFTISLATATWNLRPWKLRHTGVLMIHTSLLIIMAGAAITRHIGYEGTLRIQEGKSVDQVTLKDMVLEVYDASTERLSQTFDTPFSNMNSKEFLNQRFITTGGTELVVDRFYTDGVSEEEILGGGPEDNPALHYVFKSAFFTEDGWLLSRDNRRNSEKFGGLLEFRFAEFPDMAAWQARIAPGETSTVGRLELNLEGKEYDFQASEGGHYELDGGYQLHVIKAFANFNLGSGGSYQDSPGEANNPALEFELLLPKRGLKDHYVSFGRMPDFDPLHGKEASLPRATARFTYGASSGGIADKQVLFGLVPEGLQVAWRGPEGQPVTSALMPGTDTITLPWMGFQLSVDQFFPRAWSRDNMVNEGNKNQNPSIRLNVSHGDHTIQEWLSYGQIKPFNFEGKQWMIGFFPRRVPLGFTVQLDDFVEDRYPGSAMAMAYASYVTVSDEDPDAPAEWKQKEVEISMNKPLVYSGYKVFQSSFERASRPGAPEVTVLSVNRDPGDEVVYFGSITLVLGLIVVFVFKKKLVEIERRRNRAA